jgi:hypothetical protein
MKPTGHICVGSIIAFAVSGLAACSEETPAFDVEYKGAPTLSSLDALPDESTPAAELEENSLNRNHIEDTAVRRNTKVLRTGVDDLANEIGATSADDLRLGSYRTSFSLGSLQSSEMDIDLDQLLNEQRIVMTGSTSDEFISTQQVNRPSYIDQFQQGFTGIKEDLFDQTAEPGGILDVMLVVDNSGSMAEEQTNLASKLDPLLSYVSGSDWRIAVNTTDPNNGCVTDLITKQDSDQSTKFSTAVTKGTSGSGNERGILQARSGLEGACLSTPWIRAQSTVAVLIISDEDNCSVNGGHCAGQSYATNSYLYDYLNQIRVAGSTAKVYGIISHPSQPCSSAYNVGTQYADIISRTGGTWGDICESDYSATLRSISQDIAASLKSQFALSHTPVAGSLEVYINDIRQNSGFTLTANIVEFSTAPAAGSRIKFRYQHSSNITRNFTLSNAAASDSIAVEIDGQPTSAFTYNANNRRLSFDSNPPDSAQIMARYRGNSSLNTRFAIGSAVIESSLRVRLNGNQSTSGFSYDKQTGELVFSTAPTDATQIEVEFDRLAVAKLRYPLVNASGIRVVDSKTSQAVPYSIDRQDIVFANADYRFNRHISVLSAGQVIGDGRFELPSIPVSESVTVASQNQSCDIRNGLQIDGSSLIVDGCQFEDSESNLKISWQYWQKATGPLVIDANAIDPSAEIQLWTVTVDGKLFTNYQIENHKIFIKDDEVPSTAEIVVEIDFLRTP